MGRFDDITRESLDAEARAAAARSEAKSAAFQAKLAKGWADMEALAQEALAVLRREGVDPVKPDHPVEPTGTWVKGYDLNAFWIDESGRIMGHHSTPPKGAGIAWGSEFAYLSVSDFISTWKVGIDNEPYREVYNGSLHGGDGGHERQSMVDVVAGALRRLVRGMPGTP